MFPSSGPQVGKDVQSCSGAGHFQTIFFGQTKRVYKVGVMNVKLRTEEARRYVLDAVDKELEVCVVIDSGLRKAGNVAMEQIVEREGFRWIGKERRGERSQIGGIGFIVRRGWEVERLGWEGDTGGWIRISNDSDSMVIGGIYRAPSMNLRESLGGMREMIMRYREEMVVVVGDFNCRIGKLGNRVVVGDWR